MEEEDQNKYFQPQTPHFFKTILHDTIRNRKLGIPKSFVREYGRSLWLNKVYLKVTTGDTWKVELHKEEDGTMWLNNGWQQFVEFYNVTFGHFLVFGYLGNSAFKVLIFDNTTLEIKYPYKCSTCNETCTNVNPCLLPLMPEIEESDFEMLADTNSSRKGLAGEESSVDIQCGSASNLISKYPFCKLNITKALLKRSSVPIRKGFLKHFKRRVQQLVRLEVAGKWWHVEVCLYPRSRQGTFASGWKKFAMENSLQVGDICLFELIEKKDMVLRVSIHKGCMKV